MDCVVIVRMVKWTQGNRKAEGSSLKLFSITVNKRFCLSHSPAIVVSWTHKDGYKGLIALRKERGLMCKMLFNQFLDVVMKLYKEFHTRFLQNNGIEQAWPKQFLL